MFTILSDIMKIVLALKESLYKIMYHIIIFIDLDYYLLIYLNFLLNMFCIWRSLISKVGFNRK